MSGNRKIFFDTTPLIYFLENSTVFSQSVEQKINECIQTRTNIFISVLGCGEYLVVPYREKDKEQEKRFFKFIKDLNIKVTDINLEIMKSAAQLRAKYKFLKTPDAIQIATAIDVGCDEFYTNDVGLKKVKEIEVSLIEI